MSYDSYFFTGVIQSGGSYIARLDGEFIGSYSTWVEANAALKLAKRK